MVFHFMSLSGGGAELSVDDLYKRTVQEVDSLKEQLGELLKCCLRLFMTIIADPYTALCDFS